MNQHEAEAALAKAREKLTKLRIMETRIDDPKLGLCARCGRPIPLGRLLLMPESGTCVRCSR